MRTKRGFTLIELLVVIAIIAILAAILFPVFAQAREAARKTSCLSNLKQFNIAVQMYAQDYDELLPGLFQTGSNSPYYGVWPWPVLVEPYVKSDALQDCPTTTKPGNLGPNDMPFFRSYGWNFLYLGGYGVPPASLAAVQSPADTVLMADTYSGLAAPYQNTGYYALYAPSYFAGVNDWWELKNIPGREYWGRITNRHQGGANVAFVDGHTKWARLPGTITRDNTLWDLN
jgi:prepilin-type N-terminal cleavage/methylation domain-containing protein/prepilin-type processing-associated H-X9-DG protein